MYRFKIIYLCSFLAKENICHIVSESLALTVSFIDSRKVIGITVVICTVIVQACVIVWNLARCGSKIRLIVFLVCVVLQGHHTLFSLRR